LAEASSVSARLSSPIELGWKSLRQERWVFSPPPVARRNTADISRSICTDVETIPIYRSRDARRRKNSARIAAASAVYIGGGVTDRLLETLRGTAAQEALEAKLDSGGAVVAIAAAAQSLGEFGRSLFGSGKLPGFGWLNGGVVEPNFDPSHDRRLRRLLENPAARWGLGLPAGSAVLLGPEEQTQVIGKVFLLAEPGGELEAFEGSTEIPLEEPS